MRKIRRIFYRCDKVECNKEAKFRVRLKVERLHTQKTQKGYSKDYGYYCIKHSKEFLR